MPGTITLRRTRVIGPGQKRSASSATRASLAASSAISSRIRSGRGDVDDQRVECRSLLGREDASDGFGVERIDSEAIHRLRREGHRIAGEDGVGGLHDGPRVGAGQDACAHNGPIVAATEAYGGPCGLSRRA